MCALDSEDLGPKGFQTITSIVIKVFIPLPWPGPPCTLCGLKRDKERDGMEMAADEEIELERWR